MNAKFTIALAITWFLVAAGSAEAQSGRCDRTCLEGMISTYLTALAAHEPGRLPAAPGVRYAENDQVLPLGSGEWQIAGSPGKYRHVFADPESGQVAAITTITEHGVPVIYVVRLKVDRNRISEIETQITRDALGAARYEKMGKPEEVWLEAVPPAKRIPRALLIAQTNKYYSGMERNRSQRRLFFLRQGLQSSGRRRPDHQSQDRAELRSFQRQGLFVAWLRGAIPDRLPRLRHQNP